MANAAEFPSPALLLRLFVLWLAKKARPTA